MASTERQTDWMHAQTKMACLSLFLQERRLKPDLRLSFEIQCSLQMSYPTVEATFYFLPSTVFCWSCGSCLGQHKGEVICDSSRVTVRVLPFSLGGGWSHQADLTWLKIVINFFSSVSFFFFFFFFPLLFQSYLTQKKSPDRWSICGTSFFFFSFFSFWQQSLVLLSQLPS